MKFIYLLFTCVTIGYVSSQETSGTPNISKGFNSVTNNNYTKTPKESSEPTNFDLTNCLNDDYLSSIDYFQNKLDFDDLKLNDQFNVSYHNTYKILHNKVLNEKYVLYCTSTAPLLGSEFKPTSFIQIPVKNFAVIDTRALGYLDLLGQSDNIVYVGNTTNVTTPCITKTPSLFNVRETNSKKPTYDIAIYPSTTYDDAKGVGFGLNLNATPLDNAKWLKYFSLFTNQEAEVENIYNTISTNYNNYRDTTNVDNTIRHKHNITVMKYDSSTSEFNIYQDAYFQQLISDSGATLQTWAEKNSRHSTNMKHYLQNTSFLIDLTPLSTFDGTLKGWLSWMGYSSSSAEKNSKTRLSSKQNMTKSDIPSFQNLDNLWRLDMNSQGDALDFWTRGFARPDLVIMDLIQAQKLNSSTSYSRNFLRSLSKHEAIKSKNKYECSSDIKKNIAVVAYQTDATPENTSQTQYSGLSLGAVIGISIAGGFVGLGCAATALVKMIRKIKNRKGASRSFAKLDEEQGNVVDEVPMSVVPEQSAKIAYEESISEFYEQKDQGPESHVNDPNRSTTIEPLDKEKETDKRI